MPKDLVLMTTTQSFLNYVKMSFAVENAFSCLNKYVQGHIIHKDKFMKLGYLGEEYVEKKSQILRGK